MPKIFYEVLDPNLIFGMVGRCGGGYNTVWEDWTPTGREAREKIVKEYEEGLDAICGHYKKLEESILAEGIRNPLIITCGYPVRRQVRHLPPELLTKPLYQLLLLEGTTGGSRLWVAQKHNIPVPCIINDFSNQYPGVNRIYTATQASSLFKDKPNRLIIDPRLGLTEPFDPTKIGYHLGTEWSEDKIIKQRAPLWVSIMNKYGYYVDRLQPQVLNMLAEAGVYQPSNLKKVNVNGRL